MEKLRIEVEYCVQCGWLPRAAWFSQELLGTFEADVYELALIPGRGGVFEIRAKDQLLFSRAVDGRFPEVKEVKAKIRDLVGAGSVLQSSHTMPEMERLA